MKTSTERKEINGTTEWTLTHRASLSMLFWLFILLTFQLYPVYMIQPVVNPVVQPDLTTGWTNSGCSVVRSTGCQTGLTTSWVWQPVECLYTRYNRLSNRFDNRLYCVNGALQWWQMSTQHISGHFNVSVCMKRRDLLYFITSKTLSIYCMHVSQQKVDKVTKKNTQKPKLYIKSMSKTSKLT